MLWIVIPSDHDSSEVVKPGKQAFDLPAALVATERTPILGRRIFAIPYPPMGRDHLDPSFLEQPLIEAIAIVGVVADHSFRLGLGEAGIERFLDERDFMWRSACCPEGDRKTMALRNCHDLGPFAALCLTNVTAPFFAEANEPSMNVSLKSSLPRRARSSANVLSTRSKVPSSTHPENRRWQVWYEGNSDAKSFVANFRSWDPKRPDSDGAIWDCVAFQPGSATDRAPKTSTESIWTTFTIGTGLYLSLTMEP